MKYLIIIDNGQIYSDHTHKPIAVCESKEEAEKAKASWDEWFIRLCLKYEDDCLGAPWENGDQWMTDNPPPMSAGPDWLYRLENKVSILPVPEWAEGRP